MQCGQPSKAASVCKVQHSVRLSCVNSKSGLLQYWLDELKVYIDTNPKDQRFRAGPCHQNMTHGTRMQGTLPAKLVRSAVRLTKQPIVLPCSSGLCRPELGVPTTRSSLLLYLASSTLKAASTVTNKLLPLTWARNRKRHTMSIDSLTCNVAVICCYAKKG